MSNILLSVLRITVVLYKKLSNVVKKEKEMT